MVVVDGVTARAADGTTLLDDVSFSLRRGWLVAVVGPTGAGKTSLANVLSGMAGLEAGTIHLDVSTWPPPTPIRPARPTRA